MEIKEHKQELEENGFSIINNVFSSKEIDSLIEAINSIDSASSAFRKTEDLFAIRSFLKVVPKAKELIFNKNIINIIDQIFGPDHFIIKSIYFDKPPLSNWFVSWHQDIIISVTEKIEASGYNSWTTKQGQYAVQPPLEILESVYTLRIHLDDCDESNGALKVIPGSRKKGVIRKDTKPIEEKDVVVCNVKKGGVMLMRPLTLHSSSRSTSNNQRRVLHIEFANKDLIKGTNWSEREKIIPT